MATAAEIQTAAQAVVDAQAALVTATNLFNTHEGAAYDACAAEQVALAAASTAFQTALAAARAADPEWPDAQQAASDAQLALGATIIALNDAIASYDGQ